MWNTGTLKEPWRSKPLELREAFVKAANQALERGRSLSEQEFAGITAMRVVEKSRIEKSAVELRKQVEAQKPPSHVSAITKAVELKKQQAKPETLPSPSDKTKAITGVTFDSQGRLVVLFDDGTRLQSNQLPIQEVVEQHITIQQKQETTPVGPGGVSEFDDINELDRTMIYDVNGRLERINFESGNYKVFTYTGDDLTQVDYVKSGSTYRKTMTYSSGNLVSVNYQII